MPHRSRPTASRKTNRLLTCFCTLALVGCLSGCHSDDQVERYQVARDKSPHRMLGAIVPRGERGWFFKVTGANEVVAEEAERFQGFIESIQFGEGDDAEPDWILPEGWVQEPGKEMRFATIRIKTDQQPLELSVIPLPMPPTDGMLSNINRWRGQLGLAAVDKDELAEESKTVNLTNGTATLVNLVGKSGATAPMSAPAVSRGAADLDAARVAAHAAAGIEESVSQEKSTAAASITFDAPPEWQPGQRVVSRSAFAVPREAAFVVTEGEQKADISVTALPASAGAVLPNVNRWRGQIGLEPFTQEQLDKQATKVDMNGVEGEYFRLIGPQQAILGVIATHGGKAWFVKLQGDHDLAGKLAEQFETFVRSIRFQGTE